MPKGAFAKTPPRDLDFPITFIRFDSEPQYLAVNQHNSGTVKVPQ